VRYNFKPGGKTKIEIKAMNPITENMVEESYTATVKIQRLVDGFPDLFLRKEIDIVNGKCDLVFDSPETTANLFLKIKPTSDGYQNPNDEEKAHGSAGSNVQRHTSMLCYRS
jgi:hypothetical protein